MTGNPAVIDHLFLLEPGLLQITVLPLLLILSRRHFVWIQGGEVSDEGGHVYLDKLRDGVDSSTGWEAHADYIVVSLRVWNGAGNEYVVSWKGLYRPLQERDIKRGRIESDCWLLWDRVGRDQRRKWAMRAHLFVDSRSRLSWTTVVICSEDWHLLIFFLLCAVRLGIMRVLLEQDVDRELGKPGGRYQNPRVAAQGKRPLLMGQAS